MTVPIRADAARLLLDLNPPDWLLSHSSAVAEVAAFLAARIRDRGGDLAPDLPEAAALLHDIDKTPPLNELREELGHGFAGATWLTNKGYGELAAAVANHPATRLGDEPAFTQWLVNASLVEKLVAYADKRAALDVIALSERFDEWERRHTGRADQIKRGRPLARRLEDEVCAAAGIKPADVRRLPWVDEAVLSAREATQVDSGRR